MASRRAARSIGKGYRRWISLGYTACVSACISVSEPAAWPAADGSVILGDANSYAYTGTLDAPSFPVAELSDARLSWEDLRTDLRCHALDPVADIDNTALIVFPSLTQAEVEAGLGEDTLEQVDMGVYLSYEPGDTPSVRLSQFSFFGTDPDIETRFTADSGTWLVLLTTGTELAIGTRMLAFLEPTVGETRTDGAVTDGCPVLDFDARLTELVPVPVLEAGPWRVDWSGLTRDGRGGTFVETRADSLMIARYDEDLPRLEANFLDLESLAEGAWTTPLTGGTSLDLGVASGPSGLFPGFTEDGTWLLALLCSTCPNPAPLFLTQLLPS